SSHASKDASAHGPSVFAVVFGSSGANANAREPPIRDASARSSATEPDVSGIGVSTVTFSSWQVQKRTGPSPSTFDPPTETLSAADDVETARRQPGSTLDSSAPGA